MSRIKLCRVCKSANISKFFDLGMSPNANSLLDNPSDNEEFYPLSLSFCMDCQLVQLNYTVDPKKLFSDYVWVTGTSRGAKEFSFQFYQDLVARHDGSKNDYVLEIASNDGTFLKPFIENGYEVLGVDPAANVVKMAIDEGIPTRCDFWGKETAAALLESRGPAGMVFARNVLAHVADLDDFVGGLASILCRSGLAVIEVHYAGDILEGLQYDSIYHEHLCYFSLRSIEMLLARHRLYPMAVVPSPISGGALIIYITQLEGAEEPSVDQYRWQEAKDGVNTLESWEGFTCRSFTHKSCLRSLLFDAIEDDNNIIGWGASARSSTLLNFCQIDSSFIPVIADNSCLKHGKYTAGTHIPIVSPKQAMERNPKTVVILAWNFKDEIIRELKDKFNYKGRCLVVLPNEPQIIEV